MRVINKPTEKQLRCIANIEKILDIKFTGKSKQEAWLWTNKNIPLAKEEIYNQIINEKKLPIEVNVRNVNRWSDHPDNYKLRYMEGFKKSGTYTYDRESLDDEIRMLIMGMEIF